MTRGKIGMKKGKCIWAVAFAVVFCLVFGGLCIYKIEGIYRRVSKLKEAAAAAVEYKNMHRPLADITNRKPLEDEAGAWYTKYHFIAHGGGGIRGRTYTNSLEAWENSYRGGIRVFDADFVFTSDGELVLRHSWNDNLEQADCSMRESNRLIDANGHMQYIFDGSRIPSYEEFMNTKIYYLYTPMSCEDMIRFMANHDDLYVACDMKNDMKISYEKLVDMARELSSEDILDRIIVNLYDYETYDIIMNIYPFKNVTLRQHYVSPNNYYELIDFCLSHNVHVVNLSVCYIEDEGVRLLISKGIHVYVAVVDYISDMRDYRALGADGAVTNWLYEEDWKYIK